MADGRGSYEDRRTSSANGSPDNNSKSSALRWFESHPLVATVLWVLGAEVQESASEEKHSGSKKKQPLTRSLSWRDDRGGSIVDSNSQAGRARFNDSNILHGGTSSSDESQGVLLKRNTIQYSDRDSDTTRESFGTGTDSPNNNYGFYVTISPPQEHKFPRVPKDDIDT